MKLRIKNTPIWVEATGYTDVMEQTLICYTKNGEITFIDEKDLTPLTIKESVQAFIWSVFAKDGNRINQIKFVLGAIITGFIFGILIL